MVFAALAVAGCSGAGRGTLVTADVGHHRVRFVLPKGWEHLDHGRQQLFRLGEEQVSLSDLGPVLPDTTPDRLLQFALDHSEPMHGHEVSRSVQRTIHGSHWYDYELWDLVSHGDRARRAFVLNDSCLLVLSTDMGLYERLQPGFDAVLESIEVLPADTKR